MLDLRLAVLKAWNGEAGDVASFQSAMEKSGVNLEVAKEFLLAAAELTARIETLGGSSEEKVKSSVEDWNATIEAPRGLVAATKTLVQMLKSTLKRQANAEEKQRQKAASDKRKAAAAQAKKASGCQRLKLNCPVEQS